MIDFHGQIIRDDVTNEFLAKIAQNHQKNPRNNHKMSMKFLQKSKELTKNLDSNDYLHKYIPTKSNRILKKERP